jgi:isopentenyldiphosphate isomerase
MEYFDVVDKKDRVIGKASREEVYDKLLMHRVSHILIFNDKKELLLQLRGKKVSYCPNHWVTSVGGHVRAGESYEEAALREYKEELGKTKKISFFKKECFTKPGKDHKRFHTIFKTFDNGPFKIDKHDVEKVCFFSIKKIQEMVDKGEKFHPDLKFILKKHFKVKV